MRRAGLGAGRAGRIVETEEMPKKMQLSSRSLLRRSWVRPEKTEGGESSSDSVQKDSERCQTGPDGQLAKEAVTAATGATRRRARRS